MYLLEYIAASMLIIVLQRLPLAFVNKLGSTAGFIAYYVVPLRRSVALTNLRTAFPEKSERERKRICRNAYRNFGMTFLEYLCLSTLSAEKIKKMVSFDPPDALHNALAKDKGVIVVTGHFSSFELLGVAIANSGIPFDVVVKAMKNPKIEGILDRFRSRTNLGVIKVKDGFARIVQSVAQKRVVGLVADQDAGINGVFVRFLGVESSTPAGAAVLAMRTQAPMVAPFIIRKEPAKYCAKVESVSYENLPENRDDRIREITHRYSSILEMYIRQYPEQYFWMHKRWKTAGIYT